MKSPVPETRNSLILRLPDNRDVEAWDQFVSIYEPLVYRLARARGFRDGDLRRSCREYPDARADASNWDLMNDGMGNPKNDGSMLLAHKAPLSMASGILSDAKAAMRSEHTHFLFTIPAEEDTMGIDGYLKSLEPLPIPYLVDAKLSPAAQRGKKLLFDAKVNCAKCHREPLSIDMLVDDVGSRGQYDRRNTFDTPTLIECRRTRPLRARPAGESV